MTRTVVHWLLSQRRAATAHDGHARCTLAAPMNTRMLESRGRGRRHSDIFVALAVALSGVSSNGCGSDKNLGGADGAIDQPADVLSVPADGPKDLRIPDLAPEAQVTSDGAACSSPKVWRYEEPGCGAEAHPICGTAQSDGCLALVCGCDGETLSGCDYFTKPWQSRGLCPGACYTPTHNLEVAEAGLSLIKGCACDPAVDREECVTLTWGRRPMTCVQGTWSLDVNNPCGADG